MFALPVCVRACIRYARADIREMLVRLRKVYLELRAGELDARFGSCQRSLRCVAKLLHHFCVVWWEILVWLRGEPVTLLCRKKAPGGVSSHLADCGQSTGRHILLV